MTPKTFIFMGQSGSGKGTQAKLLQDHLAKNDPSSPILYVETGARFREFITKPGYTNGLSNRIMDEGGRQPDFLAIWNWGDLLVREMKENTHLFFDGAARSKEEAIMLDTAISFYERRDVHVFFLSASAEWTKQKALERGRKYDLIPGEAEVKMKWFKEKVVPALEFFKTDPRYRFIEINGEQSIEKVHADIIASVNW